MAASGDRLTLLGNSKQELPAEELPTVAATAKVVAIDPIARAVVVASIKVTEAAAAVASVSDSVASGRGRR